MHYCFERHTTMKLAIVSRGRALYSTRRLISTARTRGHNVLVLDPFRVVLAAPGKRGIQALYEGASMHDIDCVIPRIGSTTADSIINLLSHLNALGVHSLNGADSIRHSRDKFQSIQHLAVHDIPVPRTALTRNLEDLDNAMAAVGGPPYIIKLREGTQGIGVMKADSKHAARSVIHAMWSLDQSVLLQEFIEESSGEDIRVFIVDGKVIGTMKRSSQGRDFRSNLHLGGSASRVPLTSEMREIALASAALFDLRVAGVDLLISERGPLVTEVNPSPGLEGIEGITGLDVSKSIIRAAENLVWAKR